MSERQHGILITGAAGHLGQAVASAFHRQGARLILLDRDAEALRKAFGTIADAVLVEVDLLDRDAVSARVAEAIRQVGRIDTLCHLAGGFRMGETVHETSAQTWDFLLGLNAGSLLGISAAVVPHLIERGGGHIVTIGAGAARQGQAAMGAYCASKSALIRLTEAMSAELRSHGINVNCVMPSIIDTPDNRAAMPDADTSAWVQPAALADVITFLSSTAARAIHGAAIPV